MPGIFETPLSRRNFLAASAAMAGGLTISAKSLTADDPNEGIARLALLSDTHIPAVAPNGHRGFVPAENLQMCVPQVVESAAVAAIINGDAARLVGEVDDYVVLKELLTPVAERMPVHIGLGNHDDRDNFFRIFEQQERPELVQGKHVSVFEVAGTRFVVLDSLLYVNQVAGLLGRVQREWLAEFLNDNDERPIVFFVHHTLGDFDTDLLDFDRVFRIMEPYHKVKAIFYGHSHRYLVEQRGHIQLINQPAVGYNFNDEQPVGWLYAEFDNSGVHLTLHAVGGNTEGNGQTLRVDWS